MGGGASPPAAPSDLVATAVSSSQIDLSWTDNSNDETGFSIEMDDGGGYAEIDTVAADETTYSATGLDPSTEYTFRVRAFRDAVYSNYSNEASDTTDADVTPQQFVTAGGILVNESSSANQLFVTADGTLVQENAA